MAGAQTTSTDSIPTLAKFLKKGKLNFHSRTYFMGTLNEGSSTDFFTIAQSLGVKYKTPAFYGFQIQAGGYLSMRLAEHNLIDENTGEWNKARYEKPLYDINNPNNHYNLGILDEVYLSYKHKNLSFKLGRQSYETPLMNKNYNRLRPNMFQGLSAKYKLNDFTVSGAWFISEAVRGTMRTYSMANSFGVYGQGKNRNGEKHDYHNHISSLGVGVFGVQHELKNLKTQVWNYTAENVFNMSFLQSDYRLEKDDLTYIIGGQGFYEYALNHGGNKDQTRTYICADEQSFGFGGQLGINVKDQHQFTANYLAISDQGRFLFPREWGREQFYASQTTELFEGYGGLNAYVLRYRFQSKNKRHASIVSGGFVDQPGLDEVELNKYQLADYYHFLIEHKYHFQKQLEGLSLRFIATYKTDFSKNEMSAAQKLNKVDMINLNLVLDYHL
ncbi:hypothetical protein CW751_07045 [Brumimicrobium salinarum]|uniref:Outer membrane porin, OprD family n=1 Tax=Brumimicrobium salinarum TaxID=2058658 RepID=A0A2I0R2W0_9FLAO|nr:hypothetical protein CW751_07045 [Brumimicrobium salinarum]